MTRFYCLLLIFLSSLTSSFAQTTPPNTCGFDDVMAHRLAESPELRRQFDANEAAIRQYIDRQQQLDRLWANGTSSTNGTAATVYTIPVVVHVIHTGGAIGSIYNPSDAQIQGAIAGLNSFWRKGLSTSGGADLELNFALATRSPDCGVTTTGINRVDGSGLAGYTANGINGSGTTGASETAVKALSKWSNQDYVNIWVVSKIDGYDGTSGSGVVGYAYYPGAPASLDGIVLVAAWMTQSSRVLAHEMGHVFSLRHTFQGDGTGTTCPASDQDLVSDTEIHKRGDCSLNGTINPCTAATYAITDVSLNYTVLNNYMNYASTSCLNMFTEGQKIRVRATIDGARASLKNGYGFSTNALVPPTTTTASATGAYIYSTSGSTTTYYNCAGVNMIASSLAFVTYQWQKDGANIAGATASTYTATASGAYQVIQTPCGGTASTSNAIIVGTIPAASPSVSPAANRICSGSTLTLTVTTDGFAAVSDTYQWYKNGAAIAGATASTYGATTAGSYRCDATRCGTTVSSPAQTLAVGSTPAVACTPTFTNAPGNYFGLQNLTMDAINASSGTSGGDGANYVDRTCAYQANTTIGATLSFSVKTYNTAYVKVYLDKNNDGNFVEVASISTTGGGTSSGSGSFIVPTGTLLNTPLRLRIATTANFYGGSNIVSACGLNEPVNTTIPYGSGQIEDFTLIVAAQLPVDLLRFSASLTTDKTVAIAWATATETDNGAFLIQRSRDLIRFDTLAVVEGKGQSRTRTDYALTDARPYAGQSYYRLVQRDYDGTLHTYRPVSVLVDSDVAGLSAWPNPTVGKAFIVSQSGINEGAVGVTNILGQSVGFSREPLTPDQVRLTLGGASAGVYFVQVGEGAARQTVRVVVE